jgi:putative addiction module component (TIGR02574 family)
MVSRVEDLSLELLGLPASDRALLAERLISSLDESRATNSEAQWIKEAKRRSAEIDQGIVECIPADEAFRRAGQDLK